MSEMPRRLCNFPGLEIQLNFTVVDLAEIKLVKLRNYVLEYDKARKFGVGELYSLTISYPSLMNIEHLKLVGLLL